MLDIQPIFIRIGVTCMQIDNFPMGVSMPMETSDMPLLPADDASSALEGQIFDQLIAQSMSEMQKRQTEIKESLEKMNEDA